MLKTCLFGHQVNMEFCSELRKTAAEISKMLKTLLKWNQLIYMFLNSLKIHRGHEDLKGYPMSWWSSAPWNPAAVAKLVSWDPKAIEWHKKLLEDQLHVNWEKIFLILCDLWKRKMCTKLVTLSHRWAQWSAFWWIVVFWK